MILNFIQNLFLIDYWIFKNLILRLIKQNQILMEKEQQELINVLNSIIANNNVSSALRDAADKKLQEIISKLA